MNFTVIKLIVFLLSSFMLLSIGLYFTTNHIKFVYSAEQTSGEIIEILGQRSAKGADLYHPIVRYQPLGYEGVIQFTAKPGLWSWLYDVGGEVAVVYHPENPHEAKIKSFWMLWFLPLVAMLFGIMALFLAWDTWQKKS